MPCVPRVARRGLPRLALAALLLIAPATAHAQDVEPNIVGGTEAEPGEYPWQVAVLTRSGGPNAFGVICGGTLISEFEVVTAAHCTTGNKHDVYRVRVGSQLRSGGTEISVSSHAEHPQFNSATLENDAAVLHLAASGTSAGGQVLQLIGPEGSADDAFWAPGDSLAISGWGSTFSGGPQQEQLREARVPRVADSTCAQPDYYGSEFFPATMVCAGPDAGGIDTCQGDSGGPLAASTQTPPPSGETDPAQWRLAGITSWGFGCAQPKKPGVYTRVAAPGIRNWILGSIPPAPAQFPLMVTVGGSGGGTVTSNPVGINCGTDCSNNYVDGTSVTLTAAEAAGSTFAGWGGACLASGTATQCTVAMTAARDVTATFNTAPPGNETLTVSLPGSGEGTVTSSPVGITCPSDCSQSYPNGTDVTLTATAMGGSTFAGWGGACSASGTAAQCNVDMTQTRSVTATFNPPPTHALTVFVAGTGSGNILSNPDGINCPGDCSNSYSAGDNVTLTANPGGGSTFAGWSGACSGVSTQCTVSMTQARNVTATFNTAPPPPPGTQTLTVSVSGTGSGTVTSSPPGIDCPSVACSQAYTDGTSVTLTANPVAGSTFAGWSGACSGASIPCTVSMTQARNVTATFDPAAQTPADSTPPPDENVQPRNPPVVAIRSDLLRVSRRGYVRVPLKCKESGTDKCVGIVRIRARLPVEASAAATELRTIGHASFRIDVGDTKRVRFRLTRRARRLIREEGELTARVVVLATDSGGKTHKVVRKVTLRKARPAT